MIRVRDLGLTAGSRRLLDDVCFDVPPGELIAVLGPNGAGKTTLLRTLAGVLAPKHGSVTIGDRDVHKLPASLRAQLIAHIAGDDLFVDRLTVRDVVSMGRYPHHRWWQWREESADERAVAQALGAVHMHPFIFRRFDTLSSGERQRIWLALALAQQAPVLLLDEPTSHLDVGVAHGILHLLHEQSRAGKTMMCVLHDLNEAAQYADRILLLGNGRVLAYDEPENVLTPALLEACYGIRMETIRSGRGIRVFPASA